MKKVVGIVPTARLFQNDDFYADNYVFVNNYIKRIAENDGIPVGIVSEDGYAIEPQLQLCNSFLICGGGRIYPYHFQVVDYAVRNNKPVFGICLGMQVICSYFQVLEESSRRKYQGSLLGLYEQMKKEGYMFTEPVEHHWDVAMTRNNIDDTKHRVIIKEGTRLYGLVKSNAIMASTMHKYRIRSAPESLIVSAKAEDGTVEAVEYGENIIGVQFHPEVERKLDCLFRTLTK
jgi:gamma-glutamyl-gamma-aminobutyrate hydrolase PuuD